MGAVCGTSWCFTIWPQGFIKNEDPSIEFLELYALVVGVVNWISRFQNSRIILFCANQSVVHMVNNTTSSCRKCMILIRTLVLESLVNNVCIFAKYIRSKVNKASDYLSRLKFEAFRVLRDDWDMVETKMPQKLWPIEKVWNAIQ